MYLVLGSENCFCWREGGDKSDSHGCWLSKYTACTYQLCLSVLQSRTPALIFEHVNNTDFKVSLQVFSSANIFKFCCFVDVCLFLFDHF